MQATNAESLLWRLLGQLGQSIHHEKDGIDPLTGAYVPTPCYSGRPDWQDVLNKISSNHSGSRVGVFVCGPPGMSSQLKGLCNKANQQVKGDVATRYVFHKQHF